MTDKPDSETVVVDKASWEAAQRAVAGMTQMVAAQQTQRGEMLVDAAIRAGKFAPARREHWMKLFSADPVGTEAVLATLAPGAIPMGMIGVSENPTEYGAPGGDQAYPADWLNESERAAKQQFAASGTGSRVTHTND